jgi:sulfonate transport system permease protein
MSAPAPERTVVVSAYPVAVAVAVATRPSAAPLKVVVPQHGVAAPRAARLPPRPAPTGRSLLHVGQYLLVPVGGFIAWWSLSAYGLVSDKILPGPAAVTRTFQELLATGELTANLGVSLLRVARGALLGTTIGLALGLLLGFSSAAERWIGPTFRTLAQIPSIALIPLLMMVLGIDDKLKLFIMAKACVIPLALVTADGIRNIPRAYLEVGEVFRLSRWRAIRLIVLPGALPPILIGLRQGLAQVWVSLVAVEVLASAEGLGYLMTWGRLIFQLDIVLVCVVLIGAIGFALDVGVRKVEARLLRWRGSPG